MNPNQKIAEVYKQMLLDEAKKKMDPVGDADADIDNDGDVDDSDEYLHNRRKAIKKNMKEEQTECPKCKGDGCDHCDDKGYHEALEIDPDDGETKKTSDKDDKKKKKDTESSSEEPMQEAAPKISMGKAKGTISATGMRGKGMKKYDVDVSVAGGKLEFKIKDEQGKFQTVGIKQAARMLGEEVDLSEFTQEELIDFMMTEDFAQLDESIAKHMSPRDAKEFLKKHNAHNADFHALPSSAASAMHDKAKELKYKKSKSAPGSTGRMFHAALQKHADKLKEAKDHGNMNNGSPRGEGLSPSAKKELERTTPMNPATDELAVNNLNFKTFKAMVKKAPMRSNDNAQGDKTMPKNNGK